VIVDRKIVVLVIHHVLEGVEHEATRESCRKEKYRFVHHALWM